MRGAPQVVVAVFCSMHDDENMTRDDVVGMSRSGNKMPFYSYNKV